MEVNSAKVDPDFHEKMTQNFKPGICIKNLNKTFQVPYYRSVFSAFSIFEFSNVKTYVLLETHLRRFSSHHIVRTTSSDSKIVLKSLM